jgi:hypothetical protein
MPKKSKAKKTNPWITHLQAYRKKNPTMSLTEAMKSAKSSYKKVGCAK